MDFDDVATHDSTGTDAAVVGTLRLWVAALREAERMSVEVKHGVLLLDSEPGLLCLELLCRFGRCSTGVCGVRRHVTVEDFAHYEDVVPPRMGSGQLHTGRNTQSLLSPGACSVLDPWKTPEGKLGAIGHNFGLIAEGRGRANAIDPDVFGLVHGEPLGLLKLGDGQ